MWQPLYVQLLPSVNSIKHTVLSIQLPWLRNELKLQFETVLEIDYSAGLSLQYFCRSESNHFQGYFHGFFVEISLYNFNLILI